MRRCPKCDHEMERQDSDPETGIIGGWDCEPCGVSLPEEYPDDDWENR